MGSEMCIRDRFISGPPIYLCVRASFHPLSHSLDPAGRLTTNLDVEENLWVDTAERRGLFGRATAPHVALTSTVSLLFVRGALGSRLSAFGLLAGRILVVDIKSLVPGRNNRSSESE